MSRPGLWLWRHRHWQWREGEDWEPEVASFVVESGGEVVLVDPLAPPPVAGRRSLSTPRSEEADGGLHHQARPRPRPRPLLPLVRHPGPRSLALLERRCAEGGRQARPAGRGPPWWPRRALRRPWRNRAADLPARAASDRFRGRDDRAEVGRRPAPGLVDARPRATALPALRALLDLPFEHVLVSHGEPVHTRADFEAALEREPWSREEGS